MVFDKLREWEFFLEKSKLDLYSKKLECLGHIIDDNGIHADPDKMSRVRNWPVPKDKNDLQRFLGLVQYLAHFMPDVTAWTGPLAAIQGESGSVRVPSSTYDLSHDLSHDPLYCSITFYNFLLLLVSITFQNILCLLSHTTSNSI